ncbi:MAG: hypothetical protein NTW78_01925 [Campylobacterales bacterium]|nr:hypothetical protein [Campylobacterales bacterium]
MEVLKIIGVLAGLILLAMFVTSMNAYTQKKYKYEIFNWYNLAAAGAGYAFILFGRSWYLESLNINGDILNGIILIVIGVITLGLVVRNNIRKTSLTFELLFSVVQLALYIPAAVVAFYGLLAAAAFFAQTKPVYSINGRG